MDADQLTPELAQDAPRHSMQRLVRFWKCWTNNCRSRLDHGLYITHATTDTGSRTLCGVRFQEFSDEITPENGIGCLKCRRIMSKANAKCAGTDASEKTP